MPRPSKTSLTQGTKAASMVAGAAKVSFATERIPRGRGLAASRVRRPGLRDAPVVTITSVASGNGKG